jgi:hypothetical protein
VKRISSFVVSAFFLLSASSLLSGCGGGGGGDSGSPGGTPGGATYGTLALSGTGTSTTGTSFPALTRLAISGSGVTVTQWYNIDLTAGTTYPFVVLVVMQDSLGAVTSVSISHMTSQSTASAQWVAPAAPSPAEASATASTVTFTNLVVPGYAAAGTTTSLTLNGTLNF